MSSRILPPFEMLIPESIESATQMLFKYQDRASVMAGGTDLLVDMKHGFKSEYLLALSHIPDLDYIRYDKEEGLFIGPMTTLSQTTDSKLIQDKYPALYESAVVNGTAQTRNMGTVLGNLLRASPAGDCSCSALALDGDVLLKSENSERRVKLSQFWLDNRLTARKPDELAIELRLLPVTHHSRSAYIKMSRTLQDLSKLCAAVAFSEKEDVLSHVRIAIGAVAPTPIRLKEIEEMMEGKILDEKVLNRVVGCIPEHIHPIDDVRSTLEYRKSVSGVLIKRTILKALKGLKGGQNEETSH